MAMMLIWMIVIGILAGYIAGLLVKGRGMGLGIDLLVGIVGSILGGFVFLAPRPRRIRFDRAAGVVRRGSCAAASIGTCAEARPTRTIRESALCF